jgi:hypothetical protein
LGLVTQLKSGADDRETPFSEGLDEPGTADASAIDIPRGIGFGTGGRCDRAKEKLKVFGHLAAALLTWVAELSWQF